MKTFLILLLLISPAYAVSTEGCTKPINMKYSFKDFFNQSFKDVDASEFNDTCIKGSSFYQESKFDDIIILKDIFPAGMKGVEFARCNLDNVKIVGTNVVGWRSVHRRIQVQNDLLDWILNPDNTPKEPTSKIDFIEKGISLKPSDIPTIKLDYPRGRD